jgi:hypothetical protein
LVEWAGSHLLHKHPPVCALRGSIYSSLGCPQSVSESGGANRALSFVLGRENSGLFAGWSQCFQTPTSSSPPCWKKEAGKNHVIQRICSQNLWSHLASSTLSQKTATGAGLLSFRPHPEVHHLFGGRSLGSHVVSEFSVLIGNKHTKPVGTSQRPSPPLASAQALFLQ